MVLHALTSLTYVVVTVARRLSYIGRSGTDGVILWLIYAPKGGETHCSGIIIHFVWTGPDDPRVTRALIMRLRLESLEFGKDYLLPEFMTEIQFPNT